MVHDDALVEALISSPATAPLDTPRRALVSYALELTRSPSAITENHVQALREAGFSDSAIHSAAAVTGYFNFVNRLALGLGVELEE